MDTNATRCPHCGKELQNPKWALCPYCGKSLRRVGTTADAPHTSGHGHGKSSIGNYAADIASFRERLQSSFHTGSVHKETDDQAVCKTTHEPEGTPGFRAAVESSRFGQIPRVTTYGIRASSGSDSATAGTTKGSGQYQKRGVILTNTEKLAKKYFSCVIDSEGTDARQLFIEWLNGYIETWARAGVEYDLLDLGYNQTGYSELLKQDNSWRGHLRVLDMYTVRHHLSDDDLLGLFIIGGDDVIPCPILSNPMLKDWQRTAKQNAMEEDVESDFLYSYPSTAVVIEEDGTISIDALAKATPRFCVGRLPVENGNVARDFREVFSYLAYAIKAFDGGIPMNKPICLSTESWAEETINILHGLGITRATDPHSKIYFSPDIDLSVESPVNAVYMEAINWADAIVINCHGASQAGNPGCVGEDENRSVQPPALIPEMIDNSQIKTVTSLACWGARHTGYRIEMSMVMQALYTGVLAYMGSTRSAYVSPGRQNGKFVLGCSALLARYYLTNLEAGMDTGEALLEAKYRYVNDPNNQDTEEQKVNCILEFNLYGDPLLCVGQHRRQRTTCTWTPKLNIATEKTWKRKYTMVYSDSKGATGKETLTDYVRRRVDQNLMVIHQRLSHYLCEHYHVEPRTLHSGYKFATQVGGEGYRLRYLDDKGAFISETIVDTDTRGDIISVTMCK